MKIHTHLDFVHPLLVTCVEKIQVDVINKHNAPFRLFETSREHDRQQILLQKGKTREPVSMHLYDFSEDPPKYATAIDYVYYDKKWSWNLRDNTILSWYKLFGNLVLDVCPELYWGGTNRRSMNFTHFELRQTVILDNISKIPCAVK